MSIGEKAETFIVRGEVVYQEETTLIASSAEEALDRVRRLIVVPNRRSPVDSSNWRIFSHATGKDVTPPEPETAPTPPVVIHLVESQSFGENDQPVRAFWNQAHADAYAKEEASMGRETTTTPINVY